MDKELHNERIARYRAKKSQFTCLIDKSDREKFNELKGSKSNPDFFRELLEYYEANIGIDYDVT